MVEFEEIYARYFSSVYLRFNLKEGLSYDEDNGLIEPGYNLDGKDRLEVEVPAK